MNHPEQVAKNIIERVRPGCNMTFRVHQSNGECDFELFHNHTAVAEGEVTMLTDALMRQTRARIFNAKQGGQFVQGSKCQKGWSVYLTEDADDIKKIRKLIDDYLAPIEASGVERFFFNHGVSLSSSFEYVGVPRSRRYTIAAAVIERNGRHLLGRQLTEAEV
jgi:hypothetical protein